jgi:glycosyltransferase involved in cell wall biosynthesis
MALYVGGRRRVAPPLVFGAGVLWHLLRHGSRYDVVHTASFPYFSLLAIALVRRLCGFHVVVDWHELWTRTYWREYLGRRGGDVGWLVQRVCARIPQRAFCFARLTAERLREEGVRGPVTALEGEYAGVLEAAEPAAAEPVVVFAGRHIPEKRAPAVVEAVAQVPGVRGIVFGDGPERARVERAAAELGDGAVHVAGFAAWRDVAGTLLRARALVLPTAREGFGLAVLEAAAHGCPSVLVAEADNAAVELLASGEAGVVCPDAEPATLATAVLGLDAEAPARARAWFDRGDFSAASTAAELRALHERLRRERGLPV